MQAGLILVTWENKLLLLVNNLLAGSVPVLTAPGSEPVCHWALSCSAGLSYSRQMCEVVAQIAREKCLLAVREELLLVRAFPCDSWFLGWPLGWSVA